MRVFVASRPFRLVKLVACACILSVCAAGQAAPQQPLERQLSETIAKIRNGKTSNSRTDASEHLATLIRRIDPRKVDDTTLTEIISLLDTQEDSVRFWVADALGHFGPRAKVAVPRLLKILSEVECQRASLTSEPAIRLALVRIGETPPPPPDCNKQRAQPQAPEAKFRKAKNAIPHRYIVVLNDDAIEDDPSLEVRRARVTAIAKRHATLYGGKFDYIYETALKGYAIELPNEAAAIAISKLPEVRFVAEDALGQIDSAPRPISFNQQQASPQAPSREIVDCRDNDAMCFIRTAQTLAEKGEQLDLALNYVKRAYAIATVPNDAVMKDGFFLTVAYVHIRRRDFDRAIATLLAGAKIAPEYGRLDQYLNYLGLAYESSGRIEEAIDTYITLAAGMKEVSSPPSEQLISLYQKRFGSLDGLKDKIEAQRLAARRKFYVDSYLMSMPAPEWSVRDLDGRQVTLSDFSGKIVVLSFLMAGGNAHEPILKFLQSQYEKYKDKGIVFVNIDFTEQPDTKEIKTNLQRIGVTIPTLVDYSQVAKRYKTILPMIVLIDEKGMTRFKYAYWPDCHPFMTAQLDYLLESK